MDVTVTLINLIRRGQRAQGLDTAQLDRARVDFLLLSGHWEKELVVEEVGGRHVLPCHKCTLPATIAATVLSVIDSLDPAVSVAPTRVQWSTVFPGDAFPETTAMQLERIRAFFGADRFGATLKAYYEHLVLKADRIKTYEGDVDALLLDPRMEVWLTDYAMATKLVGTFTETEADFPRTQQTTWACCAFIVRTVSCGMNTTVTCSRAPRTASLHSRRSNSCWPRCRLIALARAWFR